MHRSKEIAVLLVLLVGAAAFVLWYVADRRSRQQAAPAPQPQAVGPVATAATAEPVDLTKVDGKTIDFSSGQPVVKDSAEDAAAIAAAKKEMDAALAETSFAPPKKSEPPKR